RQSALREPRRDGFSFAVGEPASDRGQPESYFRRYLDGSVGYGAFDRRHLLAYDSLQPFRYSYIRRPNQPLLDGVDRQRRGDRIQHLPQWRTDWQRSKQFLSRHGAFSFQGLHI